MFLPAIMGSAITHDEPSSPQLQSLPSIKKVFMWQLFLLKTLFSSHTLQGPGINFVYQLVCPIAHSFFH